MKKSNVDKYGFEHDEDFDQRLHDEFISSYLPVLNRRNQRWGTEMQNQTKVKHNRKMKRFCRKGIPAEYRPVAWMTLTNAESRMKMSPNLYRDLLARSIDPALEETIRLDLHRTFPDNIHFRSSDDFETLQVPLYNILKCIALKNPQVGYCQGLNFVTGLLLLIIKNEEKIFWLMDTLITEILPDFYNPNMKALKAEQELLGQIVKWKLPDVHDHLRILGVPWALIGTKWFICMYADVMPVETVLRIWDCVFYEGSKVLQRVAITLIALNKDKILACKDFPEAVDLIQKSVKQPSCLHCHNFLTHIFNEPGSFPRSRINSLRDTCFSEVT